jgi:hypothetical protein
VTTAELGTLAKTDVGTESGMFDHETIATDGLDAKTMTCVAGNEETHETGTAWGEDHVLGIVTVAGAVTKLETLT